MGLAPATPIAHIVFTYDLSIYKIMSKYTHMWRFKLMLYIYKSLSEVYIMKTYFLKKYMVLRTLRHFYQVVLQWESVDVSPPTAKKKKYKIVTACYQVVSSCLAWKRLHTQKVTTERHPNITASPPVVVTSQPPQLFTLHLKSRRWGSGKKKVLSLHLCFGLSLPRAGTLQSFLL